MAELLKDIFDESFIDDIAIKIKYVYHVFDIKKFKLKILDKSWSALVLKERIRKISITVGEFISLSYPLSLKILEKAFFNCSGFPYLFLPDFVAVYGLDDWKNSIKALETFTVSSSSEFAIRPFINKYPIETMNKMKEFAQSQNEHVRRLASEGCRPRLPWAGALEMFKKDPGPVIEILEILKNDKSLYVKKSVANNINDISKDNPEIVLSLAQRWKNQSNDVDWILKKGLRTLLKEKNPAVLDLFGYENKPNKPLVTSSSLTIKPLKIYMGEKVELFYDFTLRKGLPALVRLEYLVNFVRSGDKISKKLFFLSEKKVSGGETVKGSHKHNFKNYSTRKHYPGEHKIFLLLNGREIASSSVKLLEK
jgi:3-methyladenine DNA glycosylase AlkC